MQYKTLIIKGTILGKNQLEDYLEKVALNHNLQNNSNKNTYPIPRLKENFEFITKVYNLLNDHAKLKIPIHPAGEWILDNYYIIEETVKSIILELKKNKYTNFLGLANGSYSGFARIYVLASEIVNYTDNKIEAQNLSDYLQAYQKNKTLSMEEIWNISIFMKIALIENIRQICEKIHASQIQKYKVENIIERLVDLKNKEELQFNNINKNKITKQVEMKYTFIEYLSYKLKSYGKKAYPYVTILEEQVNRAGMTLDEAINKEHFEMAINKVSIGNCITSIKNLNRINMLEIFEKINGVEDILKQDPANVYEKMDYKTKVIYRNEIKQIAQKTKISEIYVAKKILELACSNINSKYEEKSSNIEVKKQNHVGYYLISDGKEQLLQELLEKNKKRISNNSKIVICLTILVILTLLICTLFSCYFYNGTKFSVLYAVILGILLIIPVQTIIVQIAQYIIGKFVKPKHIPKLDFEFGVPKEQATFVVIPTILNSKQKVKKMMQNLEKYYMANKSNNIYFALLGDCTSGENEKEPFDNEIILTGMQEAEKLNKKYPDNNFEKFHFLYRKRTWNTLEECYLGWERKRGLLNQFNEYLLEKGKNEFLVNTIENYKKEKLIPKIKYVITLDADTELCLNTGLELIGAMAHILNKPVLNHKKDLVVQGHALIQPRVGIPLQDVQKSYFTKLHAGSGGKDAYTNAISDIYQDNFDEGIFTGKGIYDLETFNTVLSNEIPENTVLSHDLLEGSYLRCGLATDIMLLDGYPTGYSSFKTRLHRWIRGDWQLLPWLKHTIINKRGEQKQNPLNILSRYKILDNLIRSMLEVFVLISLIYISIFKLIFNIKIWPIITLLIVAIIIPTLLELLNRIISKKDNEIKQKTFTKNISLTSAAIQRGVIALGTLPDKAYLSLNACVKSIYRVCVSKKHLLEWMTSEDSEKYAKKDIISYYKNMTLNVVFGMLAIIMGIILPSQFSNIFIFLIGLLWIITPEVICEISKEYKVIHKIDQIVENDKQYLLNLGKKTWQFFKENITQVNNYLPPDNYQENRKPKVVNRTSPTNIGLGILAVVASYDLNYENFENTINLLEKMLNTITSLQKWNGHLYNWYDTKTLQPLLPRYISSVDSGNFVGYLYTLKQFLIEIQNKFEKNTKIEQLILIVNNLIQNTDFSKLYDQNTRLFSIGFNVEENSLTNSYYDLLSSEARQTSLIAIAKKDVPARHWNNLSRTLTILNQYKGLVSWSGTAFEYFMPNINIPTYAGSLLDESCKFMLMSQKEYAKKLNIPWGISESAFYLKDLQNNYQYKAFGIPWIGLKRGLSDEMVISSYASILAINEEPNEVIKNLKILEQNGMNQKYGFYEAIDYTPTRIKKGEKYAIVKTYMAHHQGLILLAINNLFNENIMQKRFMQNPELKAVDILLQEKMPENIIITKEQKEKVEKIKYVYENDYAQREITKTNISIPQINVISNNDYTVVTNEKGESYSKYKNILINRYKKTNDIEQGIFFFIKDVKTNRIWSANKMNYMKNADKYIMYFSDDQNKIVRQDGGIETILKNSVMADSSTEIRSLELTNHSLEAATLEIISFIEPVLSPEAQDNSHPSFNNLFLNFEYIEKLESVIVTRRKRIENENQIFLGIKLYTENETVGKLEYEIDKEKFLGRNELGLPVAVKNSIPLSNSIQLTTEPITAMKRTITIQPEQKVILNLILTVAQTKQEVENNLIEFTNQETIKQGFELAKASKQAENKYLQVSAKQTELYQKMLGYLLYENPLKTFKNTINAPVSKLWQYGISGDVPILLLKINQKSQIQTLKQILKAYNNFKIKNILVDLVIINQEKYSYNGNLKEEIYTTILNENLAYMQNIKGGIFVLENLSQNEVEFLEYRANLTINAKYSNVNRYLKDLEEEYLEKVKNIPLEESVRVIENEQIKSEKLTNLKYLNDYGGFTQDGTEYVIRVNKKEKLPTVWSHILTNKTFGTLVTEGMGGYTWYKNSRLNRLTAWSNLPVQDIPSEIIYMQNQETKKVWSLGLNPCADENDYYITYGFGYAKYKHQSDEITQNLEIYVPTEDNVKVQKLRLENNSLKKKKLKLVYYIKPVLEEDELKSNGYCTLEYVENSNIICMKNIAQNENFEQYLFVSSSEKITSYTGSKQAFLGKSNLANPDAIHQIKLDNQNSLWKNAIIAIQCDVELEALENKEIIFSLGVGKNVLECQDIAYKYNNISKVKEEDEKVKDYWKNITQNLQVTTPLESTNILLNGWLIYQTLAARMYGKTGYYQSGGAYGFRDQLQDTIALKYVVPEITKQQIIKHSKHQFIEGDTQHWWHEEITMGIRTRFSDDRLWLVYLVEDYIAFTGDKEILNIQTPYLQGNILPEGIDEKYDKYEQTNFTESIYEHCKKAINISLNFGENGLPKIGSGDWNDGFSTVGNKGKGESVWLGFFIYDILKKFIPICIEKNEPELAKKYEEIMDKLKKALNTNGWDGRWFRRAFMDNGNILGSMQNEECRIDSIAQSWAVISGAADNDKKYISMESLENHLIDKENGVIKLLDPPFEKGILKPGYISSYVPGTRENGGQYTHECCCYSHSKAKLELRI